MNPLRLALALLTVALATPATAQGADDPPPVELLAETLAEWQGRELSWRSYVGRARRATATVYANVGRDGGRCPWSVVLVAHPDNPAPLTDDAPFLADMVGRELGADPVRLAFLFRFELGGRTRPLTVPATFRRSPSGRLGAPAWRVLSPDEVEDYTDRHLR